MKITPRKEEWEHVLAAIEDEGNDTPQKGAKAAIKAVCQIIDFRQLWAVVHMKRALYGPFSSESEAEKFGRTYLGKGTYAVSQMQPIAAVEANAEGAKFDKAGWCRTCRHPQYEHQLNDRGHRKGKCAHSSCSCDKWKD